MQKWARYTLTLIFFSTWSGLGSAAALTWDGGGDASTFSDPLNWDSDTAPTSSDTALIFSAEVSISSSVAVASIELTGDASLTIENGVTVTFENGTGGSVSDILELDDTASAINYGSLVFDNEDMFICIDVEDESEFENFGSIVMNGRGSLFIGVQTDEETTTFTNHIGATLEINDTDFIPIQHDGPFINDGIITIDQFGFIGIQLDAFGAAETIVHQNNGILTIRNDVVGASEYIDITNENEFRNFGIVNIEGSVEEAAFGLSGSDISILNNLECGIINLEDPTFFDLGEAAGLLLNDGVIASAYSGNHLNEGTITNNGRIQTPTGLFDFSGAGAFGGTGSVVVGEVPTMEPLLSTCPQVTGAPPVPAATSVPLAPLWLLGIMAGLLSLVGIRKLRKV
jgi:hypothetical protein